MTLYPKPISDMHPSFYGCRSRPSRSCRPPKLPLGSPPHPPAGPAPRSRNTKQIGELLFLKPFRGFPVHSRSNPACRG